MPRSRFQPDHGLSFRMGSTMFLLGLLYVVLLVALLYLFRGSAGGTFFAVLVTGGLLWGQWYFSDSMALRSMNARIVTEQQAPELHTMVERLCQLADMPKPRIAIARTDIPNAFATGRSQQRAVVCVTTGLLDRLERHEVEAVLSHELSHVAHRDVTVMTVAAAAGTLAGLLTRFGMYGGFGGGNNRGNSRDNNGAIVFLAMMLVSVLVYVISFLLIRVLSRYRELSADRSGAFLTGAPSSLASALTKISGDMARIPSRDLREAQGMNAFFFAPALSPRDAAVQLLSTHPSLDKRLAQLSKISAELGRQQ